jgi:hypothetical protein
MEPSGKVFSHVGCSYSLHKGYSNRHHLALWISCIAWKHFCVSEIPDEKGGKGDDGGSEFNYDTL